MDDKDELKKEAVEAVSQVKDVIKNVDVKAETEKTKGFFMDMAANPIGKIKSVADSGSSFLSIAMIIFVVWTAATFVRSALSAITLSWQFSNIIPRLVSIVTSTVSPAFILLALSIAVYIFYKDRAKQFMPLIITITIASAPRAIGAVLSIITILIPTSGMVIGSVNAFLNLISIVLVYFGLKAFVGEQSDESFFKNFLKIQCVYFIARIVLGAFGVSI